MIEINPNVKVKVIKDSKFKHIDVSFKFIKNFKKDEMLTDYILGEILGEYSKAYQTKSKMAKRKDELYGLNVYSYQDILCDHKVFNLTYHFLNPFFVDTKIQEYFDFIKDGLPYEGIACMDGETCEILEETEQYVLLQEEREQIPFKLSRNEFEFATVECR